ncbi:MAG TPA: hypothetical protein VE397_10740 [Stellaceae bacterium]|jgi:hypothetical protein|nr:hypothetical protein [Stellaceae bacterium]
MRHSILGAIALAAIAGAAFAQSEPDAANMKLVGYSDLQGRSADEPAIHEQDGRWIAYIGHRGGTEDDPKPLNSLTGRNEDNGTSIVDVTDPRHPQYLHHIPGAPGLGDAGGAPMVRVCDGKTLPKGDPAKTYLLRTYGTSAHEIWDVTRPSKPELLARIQDEEGTHRNWWECDTGIAYLVSGVPGWRVKQMTQVYNLADPEHPVYVRNFGLVGQQPGASGTVPPALIGAVSTGPQGNRVYFGYGTDKDGILQIVDREKLLKGPKEPTPEDLLYPQVGRIDLSAFTGAHTVFPLLGMAIAEFAHDAQPKRDFVVVTGDATSNECQEPRQMAWFIDVTSEARPMTVSSYTPAEASGDFCTRGGRFGVSAANENMTPHYYGRLMFFAALNAGVRAVDVRDPYHPIEVAHYIPAITPLSDPRCATIEGNAHCVKTIETDNVEVDDRGYVYIVDSAGNGMHILELTGAARRIANFPK